MGLYFLRARYLDVSTGRFWSMDDWEGDPESPISLHKYLYASCTPVNKIDPTGNNDFNLTSLAINAAIGGVVNALFGLNAKSTLSSVLFDLGVGAVLSVGLYGLSVGVIRLLVRARSLLGTSRFFARAAIAAESAPQAIRTGVLVDDVIAAGLVREGGKLVTVLREIESVFFLKSPKNLLDGVGVISEATANLGLTAGVQVEGSILGEYVVLNNVGGILTKILQSGEIIITNAEGKVLLHLIP